MLLYCSNSFRLYRFIRGVTFFFGSSALNFTSRLGRICFLKGTESGFDLYRFGSRTHIFQENCLTVLCLFPSGGRLRFLYAARILLEERCISPYKGDGPWGDVSFLVIYNINYSEEIMRL